MSVKEAVVSLDFNNLAELWFTEIVLYICFILIWYLLIKMSWLFCISPFSPRFKQYDAKALKPIKAQAEKARIRRESEMETTATPGTASTQQPQPATRYTSTSQTRNGSVSLKPGSNTNASYSELSPQEFKLQICKIHRSLRYCYIASLTCTTIYVTFVMLNHNLIMMDAIGRDCFVAKFAVIFLFLQRLALYLFFIFRLHYSFGPTQFGVKSVYLWSIIVAILLFGLGTTFYFFLTIVIAPDPCDSSLASRAGMPAIGQDYVFNIFLSGLFISRLLAVVKSQHKGSTTNLAQTKLKSARANYKYYYTMYKLTCLFLVALAVTTAVFVIMYTTGLAAAFSSIDSVVSNYLLFLNFQFNDNYFRVVFCGCLRLQSCCLGSDYAKEMELHFYSNTSKPAHRQSSQTWQQREMDTTANQHVAGKATMDIIKEDAPNDVQQRNDLESSLTDERSRSSDKRDSKGSSDSPRIGIKINAPEVKGSNDTMAKISVKRLNSNDSEISADSDGNTPKVPDYTPTPVTDTPLVDEAQ